MTDLPFGRRELDAALRTSFPLFVRKTFHTVDPGATYLPNWHIDLTCDYLTALQNRTLGKRHLIINYPPRYMKAESIDEPVHMGDGSYKRLAEVVVGDTVISHRGDARKVLAVSEVKEQRSLEIRTHSGRKTIAAEDHPLITTAGTKQAQDLRVGDYLGLVVSRESLESSRSLAEFRLAGYFVGDGQCSHVKEGSTAIQSNIACKNPDLQDDIMSCAASLGFVAKLNERHGRVNISGGCRDWLRDTGLAGQVSRTKRVPKFVFQGSREQIGEFLSGYMAADGTFARKGENRPFQYGSTTISPGLAEDLLHLYLRLGVNARSRRRTFDEHPFGGKDYTIYNIEISTMDGMARVAKWLNIPGKKGDKLRDEKLFFTEFDRDLIPDKIVEIVDVGLQKVKCLNVDVDHTFTCNDFATHNSILASVAWPAWILGHNPSEQIVCASYSEDLAVKHSLDCRDVIRSPWYQRIFPNTVISKDESGKRHYNTTEHGHRMAITTVGKFTGFGGNFIVIDDPQNPKMAHSVPLREDSIRWFQQTAVTRLNDKKHGSFALIMQRLHERDLTGWILAEQDQDQWEHLVIPAVAPERTYIDFGTVKKTREKGEVLHEEREGPAEMAAMRKNLGEYTFAGQYQQNPQPDGGGIIKRHFWRVWPHKEPPECVWIFQSLDTAFTEKHHRNETPSYSARTTWGIFLHDIGGENYRYCLFLLEAWREQCDYVKLRQEVMRGFEGGTGNEIDLVIIEDRASGQALRSDLKLAGINVLPYRLGRFDDKISRAHSTVSKFEQGLIYHPDRDWAYDVIDECAAFPTGTYDDWVDTVTMAVNYLDRQWVLEPPDVEPYEPPVREEKKVRSYF